MLVDALVDLWAAEKDAEKVEKTVALMGFGKAARSVAEMAVTSVAMTEAVMAVLTVSGSASWSADGSEQKTVDLPVATSDFAMAVLTDSRSVSMLVEVSILQSVGTIRTQTGVRSASSKRVC